MTPSHETDVPPYFRPLMLALERMSEHLQEAGKATYAEYFDEMAAGIQSADGLAAKLEFVRYLESSAKIGDTEDFDPADHRLWTLVFEEACALTGEG